jgi:hypothetical protein
MAFIRLMVIFGAVLAVLFVFLRLFFLARKRDALQRDWPAASPAIGKNAFIKRNIDAYDRWLVPRLALAVFGVPLGALVLIVYFTNFA